MGKPVLHQFIAGTAPGDAITDQALLLNRWLREDGFHSLIFAESIDPALAREVRSYIRYRPSYPGETVILHHSIGTTMADYLLSLDVRFVIVYHNITPPEFLRNVDPALAEQLARGKTQLISLRERTLLGLADSPYNESDLQELGFAPTGILPITLDEAQYQIDPNPELLDRYRGKGPRLLYVGRLVPNKRQEDLLKLLHAYQRIEPSAYLFLVGTPWVPGYVAWLQELVQELGLSDEVIFTGRISQRDLVTYYRVADLYVSMSEHEGFGKPLIESMYLGVPVLAYAAASVPATLGDSGVLFHEKNYEVLAELVDILTKDGTLRQRVIARQRRRVQAFLEPEVRRIWKAFLAEVDDSLSP